MNDAPPTVFVVDDDAAMCGALTCLFEAHGFDVRTCRSAEEFLDAYHPDQPGCLVLDIRMRGMSGLELQTQLARRGVTLPIIMITGHGDIPMAVRAMKTGALDFLQKPVPDKLLLQRVAAALDLDRRTRQQAAQRRALAERLATLTPREREVLDAVLEGKPNKQIASELGVCEKTIEVHRKHVLAKAGVHSTTELVREVTTFRTQAATPPNLPPPAG